MDNPKTPFQSSKPAGSLGEEYQRISVFTATVHPSPASTSRLVASIDPEPLVFVRSKLRVLRGPRVILSLFSLFDHRSAFKLSMLPRFVLRARSDADYF